MKTALIYGEFLPDSSTGIAYVNSTLDSSLNKVGYKVTRIIEPRTKDYSKSLNKIIKKNFNINEYIKLFFIFLNLKLNDISFITLSMGNLGLIKTLIIQFFLKIKSRRLYLYIHRGDLDSQYKKSFYKKSLIELIIKKSFKVIFLSEIFRIQGSIKNIEQKILVIENSLNYDDCEKASKIFKNRMIYKQRDKKILKLLFCGNIQKEKGIVNIIKAVNTLNRNLSDFKIELDIYGMRFEDLIKENDYISYKGRLKTDDRLSIMGQYDCLILASYTEGLPITLIECLSIGIPFITTNVGAIDDLLIKNYPYICKNDTKSIINNLENFIRDFRQNENLIKKVVTDNNVLFKNKYSYNNFEENIKKLIY